MILNEVVLPIVLGLRRCLKKKRVFEFLASLNKELDEVHRCVFGKEPPPSTREVFSEV